MTISTTRTDLRAALAMVAPASSAKSSIAIMDGVLFAPAGDAMRLSCTSGYASASTALACKHGGESFVVTVETLRKVVDSLPEGDVELRATDARVTVKGGNASVKLPIRGPEDFPTIAPTPAAVAKVRADVLRRLMMSTRHATLPDAPVRDGTHVRISSSKIEATAAGGHAVARAWGECESIAGMDAFVPSMAVATILKAISGLGDDALVALAVDGARMFAAHVSVQLYDVLPNPTDKILAGLSRVGEIVVDREALLTAVKRSSITAEDAKLSLLCKPESGELVVESVSQAGESIATLPATVPACERIYIAAHLLLAQLEQLPDDEARISLAGLGGLDPVMFDSANYRGVTMPMRAPTR